MNRRLSLLNLPISSNLSSNSPLVTLKPLHRIHQRPPRTGDPRRIIASESSVGLSHWRSQDGSPRPRYCCGTMGASTPSKRAIWRL
jgi:hypothetical protein